MRFFLFFSLLILLSCGSKNKSENMEAFEKMEFTDNSGTLPYRILFPNNYDKEKNYPLILILHGAGERGTDNEAQLTHGGNLFLKKELREDYPALVVFPQCPEESYWSNVEKTGSMMFAEFAFQEDGDPTIAMLQLQKLLLDLKGTYRIDDNRIYVGGLSMGGMGTFEIVRRNPDTFAAAFSICGGAHPKTATTIKSVPWWVFHGDADMIVDYEHSQKMVEALKKEGADVKFTTYEDVNHNSWENAFAEPELIPWLFSHSK
jgi:predicted peptidase